MNPDDVTKDQFVVGYLSKEKEHYDGDRYVKFSDLDPEVQRLIRKGLVADQLIEWDKRLILELSEILVAYDRRDFRAADSLTQQVVPIHNRRVEALAAYEELEESQ